MTSTILRIASRYLTPLFLFFSLLILYRGHNAPGGGFIGGLLAAAALILYAMACGVETTRAKLRIDPRILVAAGLLTALLSGALALFSGHSFLTGRWVMLHLPFLGELPLGTPLLFDLGVYLVVIGITLIMLFALMEED